MIDWDADEVFGGLEESVAARFRKTLHRAANSEPAAMTSEIQDLIGEVDEQSPLMASFEKTDVFAEPPDTTSEFARLHSPEAAERMNREFMSHGFLDDDPPPREFNKRAPAEGRRSREAYERMTPEFRKLLEANGFGYEKIGELAREAAAEMIREER